MFERQQLDHLLDVHGRSYRLLLWLNKRMRDNKLQVATIHDVISLSDAARDWLKRQLNNLPADLRPHENEIDEFSHLLASYLQTSFEVAEGKIPVDGWCGCRCMFCLYVRDATFLQARKVTDKARETAKQLKVLLLCELANDLGLPLLRTDLEPFIGVNPDLSVAISVLTYTRELMRRTSFGSQGLGVLALWREIAWTATAPKKDFKLTTNLVLEAETLVSARLREVCDAALS
ncbi:MAG: hypothetical protein IPJ49_22170 [Candidatus Obscuribacter sp.]|nr:hypothetical protein [Candidatus Obscuribacter sp.]